jgi:hypothetical protein
MATVGDVFETLERVVCEKKHVARQNVTDMTPCQNYGHLSLAIDALEDVLRGCQTEVELPEEVEALLSRFPAKQVAVATK